MRINPKRIQYEDIFTGNRKKYNLKKCPSSCPRLSKGMLEVGVLVTGAKEGGLVCDVPIKGCKECNLDDDKFCQKHTEEVDVGRSGLIKSKKRPVVLANEQGTMCLVVSSDRIKKETAVDPNELTRANKLYESFHGVPGDKVLKVDIAEPEYLVFLGWLNHIIYDVPSRSVRRGVPFIHEGKDRGDDKPPARQKPYVCISPEQDYLIMFGSQFSFTERGMIG